MAATGRLGTYAWGQYWTEQPELSVPGVIEALSRFLVGCHGVNVSYDSGLLGRGGEMPPGWSKVDGKAVSPVADVPLLESWPRSHNNCFDEWYFFRKVPEHLQIQAFCNWYTFHIEQWEILRRTDNGFDLSAQLEQLSPEAVIGSGHSIFVISRNQDLVDAFLSLAIEP